MTNEYPVLSLAALLLRILGGLIALSGACGGGYEGCVSLDGSPGPFGAPNPGHFGTSDFLSLLGGMLVGVIGVSFVAAGEAIHVLVAIEANTRRSPGGAP